jgi:hypothetical protein
MRRRLLDPVAPCQGAVHGVDRQGHAKPGVHCAKLPAKRGEQRGEPNSGSAGREAMNEIASGTRGHEVFARAETAPSIDVQRAARQIVL